LMFRVRVSSAPVCIQIEAAVKRNTVCGIKYLNIMCDGGQFVAQIAVHNDMRSSH
jgi:hypothetical protein